MIAVHRSQNSDPAPSVASLDPGIIPKRITSDEIKAVVELDYASFKLCPSVAGVEKEARDIPCVVLNDEFIRIAACELGAVCLDRIDLFGLSLESCC